MSTYLVLAGLLITVLEAGTDVAAVGDREATLKKIQQVNSAAELRAVYRDLFADANLQTLRALQFDSNDSVAVQAAWEAVTRQALSKAKDDEKQVPVNQHESERFIGFCEGRLKVPLPQWWIAGLKNCSVWTSKDGITPDNTAIDAATNVGYRCLGKSRIQVPVALDVECDDRGLSFKFMKRNYLVPQSYLVDAVNKWEDDTCVTAAGADTGSVLFAAHSSFPDSYNLILIGPDGRQLWKAKVFVEARLIWARSGAGYRHIVSLLMRNGLCYVFGMCPESAYIEVFRLKDGQSQMRFSTSY